MATTTIVEWAIVAPGSGGRVEIVPPPAAGLAYSIRRIILTLEPDTFPRGMSIEKGTGVGALTGYLMQGVVSVIGWPVEINFEWYELEPLEGLYVWMLNSGSQCTGTVELMTRRVP